MFAVEADKPAAHVHAPPVIVHADEAAAGAMLEAEQARAAVQKVAGVLKEVEGYQVRAQQRAQHLDAHRQHPEHLGRREDGQEGVPYGRVRVLARGVVRYL